MFYVAHHPCYAHSLPEGHRFPMEKYDLLQRQLLHEGTLESDNFFAPNLLSEKAILATHDANYWQKLKDQTLTRAEERRTGFPLTEQLVKRERIIMQGTLDCAIHALKHGVSMNIAGGTHHSFTDRGEGFCLLNDIALASNHLLHHQLAQKILIVDLDVHQGNGTAEIFNGNDLVFTFSMHGEKNYPMHKESSDLDIGVPDGIDDKSYLTLLDRHLKELIDKVEPDFIFYQCGVDVLSTDKLGRLGLSLNGCKERDKAVLSLCHANQIPLAAAMGGGYSEDIRYIVEAHSNTFRVAQSLYF